MVYLTLFFLLVKLGLTLDLLHRPIYFLRTDKSTFCEHYIPAAQTELPRGMYGQTCSLESTEPWCERSAFVRVCYVQSKIAERLLCGEQRRGNLTLPHVDRVYNHYQITADWLNSVQNVDPANLAMKKENQATYLNFVPCGGVPKCNNIVGFANSTFPYELVPEYIR